MEDMALGYVDVVPGTERFVRHLTVETIERGGHFGKLENPERVTELLLGFVRPERVRSQATIN